MKLRNSLRFSYLLAGWSCLTCAFGGRFLGSASGDVLLGVVLIAGGFAMSVAAMMLASVTARPHVLATAGASVLAISTDIRNFAREFSLFGGKRRGPTESGAELLGATARSVIPGHRGAWTHRLRPDVRELSRGRFEHR